MRTFKEEEIVGGGHVELVLGGVAHKPFLHKSYNCWENKHTHIHTHSMWKCRSHEINVDDCGIIDSASSMDHNKQLCVAICLRLTKYVDVMINQS